MKRMNYFHVLVMLLMSMSLSAQSDTGRYSEDTKSIQALIDAYYDCISGPIGQKRDFNRLKNLFHSEAKLIYTYWNKEETVASTLVFNTMDDYIERLDYLDKKGFYEYEIKNSIDEFGAVSQVFSSYRYYVEDKSIPSRTGITSYQLFFDGDRYWIISMLWTFESPTNKIPDKYLKK